MWIFWKLHLLEITKKQPVFQPLGWDCSRWDGIVSGHWEVRIGQHNPGHGLLLLQRGRAQGPRASQMDFNVNAFKKTTVKAHYFWNWGGPRVPSNVYYDYYVLFVSFRDNFITFQTPLSIHRQHWRLFFSGLWPPPQTHTHTQKKTKQNSQGKKQKNGDQTTKKKDSLKKPQQKKSNPAI